MGLGESWERRHKPALLRLSEKFEIRALYDDVAYRASAQAAELECDAVMGFTRLIEREDVDAVYILGESWQGMEPVRSACRALKPIFLGRPIGTAPGMDEALEEIQSSGVRFMVEFPWRFYPATVRLMELLSSGLGAPQMAFCDQLLLEPEVPASLASTQEPKWNLIAVQMADWLRFVFSEEPVSARSTVSCVAGTGPSRGFETLVARFGDSKVGQATLRRFLSPRWSEAARFQRPPSFQVIAEFGVAYLELPGEVTWFDESGQHQESLESDRPLGELLSDRFYRTIVHGLNPSPGLADAISARRMVKLAREQA